MADATVSPDTPSENRADDGRTFRDLIQVREALWRDVSDLETALNDLRGDLAAVHGLALAISEQHGSYVGPAADGLWHCSSRARDALGEIGDLHKRLHEATIVIKANDPTRLSAEAVRARFEPGPHRDPA